MSNRTLLNRIFSTLESRSWPFRVSWLRTLYFNFRSLHWKQAIKLPVYVYSNTEFQTLAGRVEIRGALRRGMVRIGKREDRGQGKTILRNHGVLRLGDAVSIMQGCDLYVGPDGLLEIGARARIRENVLIYVSGRVSIGEETGIAYQSTISDNDFHFMMDQNTREIRDTKANIHIGDRNWIGSRTVIKKGTVTPDDVTVASSYTLLDKDYTMSVPPFSVLGGLPARLLREGVRRVFNSESENMLRDHFLSGAEKFDLQCEADVEEFCSSKPRYRQ